VLRKYVLSFLRVENDNSVVVVTGNVIKMFYSFEFIGHT